MEDPRHVHAPSTPGSSASATSSVFEVRDDRDRSSSRSMINKMPLPGRHGMTDAPRAVPDDETCDVSLQAPSCTDGSEQRMRPARRRSDPSPKKSSIADTKGGATR